jgi:hypothetical protein
MRRLDSEIIFQRSAQISHGCQQKLKNKESIKTVSLDLDHKQRDPLALLSLMLLL